MSAQRYRKKPVVVEAMRYQAPSSGWVPSSGSIGKLLEWGAPVEPRGNWGKSYELIIRTLEDGSEAQVEHIASPGDWIIKGVKGEFYPCKPDIFEATYEQVFD